MILVACSDKRMPSYRGMAGALFGMREREKESEIENER